MISNVFVYLVPIGIYPGRLMVMSLIMMDGEGSRSLRAANNLRCFTGRFTKLSDSELPNSTLTGVTYLSLKNLISVVWEIWRSYVGGGRVFVGVSGSFIGLIILNGWEGLHRDVSSWMERS